MTEVPATKKPTATPKPTAKPTEDPTPKEYRNALATARNYRDNLHMSHAAIQNQLTSSYGEKFTQEEVQYAMEHLDD